MSHVCNINSSNGNGQKGARMIQNRGKKPMNNSKINELFEDEKK